MRSIYETALPFLRLQRFRQAALSAWNIGGQRWIEAGAPVQEALLKKRQRHVEQKRAFEHTTPRYQCVRPPAARVMIDAICHDTPHGSRVWLD